MCRFHDDPSTFHHAPRPLNMQKACRFSSSPRSARKAASPLRQVIPLPRLSTLRLQQRRLSAFAGRSPGRASCAPSARLGTLAPREAPPCLPSISPTHQLTHGPLEGAVCTPRGVNGVGQPEEDPLFEAFCRTVCANALSFAPDCKTYPWIILCAIPDPLFTIVFSLCAEIFTARRRTQTHIVVVVEVLSRVHRRIGEVPTESPRIYPPLYPLNCRSPLSEAL